MADTALRAGLDRLDPGPTATTLLLGLVTVEALLAFGYAASPLGAGFPDPIRFIVVQLQPFVWIDVGLLAVLTTDPPKTTDRRRRLGVLVGVGYFLVLAYFGGVIGSGMGTGQVGINWFLPPGYAPQLFYDGATVHLSILPYKLVGYAALAYLVFVTVLDAAAAAFSGVLGLFSCVSCTWPLLATVVAGVSGSSSALATAAMNQAYPLSTLVFLSAVALLMWRPSFGGGSAD